MAEADKSVDPKSLDPLAAPPNPVDPNDGPRDFSRAERDPNADDLAQAPAEPTDTHPTTVQRPMTEAQSAEMGKPADAAPDPLAEEANTDAPFRPSDPSPAPAAAPESSSALVSNLEEPEEPYSWLVNGPPIIEEPYRPLPAGTTASGEDVHAEIEALKADQAELHKTVEEHQQAVDAKFDDISTQIGEIKSAVSADPAPQPVAPTPVVEPPPPPPPAPDAPLPDDKAEREQVVEQKAAAVAKSSNRLTPAMIDEKIAGEWYANPPGTTMTICVLTLQNGYNVVGTSASISPDNFDVELEKQIARSKARDQIWDLEGYALKTQLSYGIR